MSNVTILNSETLLDRKVNAQIAQSFSKSNPSSDKSVTVKMSSKSYQGSAEHAKLWNKIAETQKKLPKYNSGANYQNPNDLYDLVDLIRADITRRTMELTDYTSSIAIEVTNPNFSSSVSLQEFLDYAAPFEEFAGVGDQVKLMQPKTGAKQAVAMTNYGVGFAGRSLNDQLYDTLYSLEKTNKAIAKGHALRRNQQVIGIIVDATYVATQKQAADTGGTSVDDKYYTTINNAINLISGLKEPQNEDEFIDIPTLHLICNPSRLRQINRSIGGRLRVGEDIKNVDALGEISTIIPYQARNIYRGTETIAYSGCAAGKAYLYVPKVAFYVLNKRGLTTVTGPGDVLSFTSEKSAWHITQGEYYKEFLGGSGGGTAGTGFVVEITLPGLT